MFTPIYYSYLTLINYCRHMYMHFLNNHCILSVNSQLRHHLQEARSQ